MATQEQLAKLRDYQQLVYRIVGGFQKKVPRHVLREDLLAAGMAGLWDAIQRHTEGDFEWYVRIKIRGAILDELRTQDWLPRRMRWLVSTEDTPLAVVRFDEVSDFERDQALACDQTDKSVLNQQRERLNKAIHQLPARDQEILAKHDLEGSTLKQIADDLGVSEPRVCQLRTRALKQLKSLMAEA